MQKPLFNAPIPTQQASLASPVASAIGNMGSAVKKVGKIAAQLQQEQERQILAEAELKMKKSSYELKDKLTNEHDPSKHVEIAQQHFDKLQGTILNNDKLTPGFQNDLGDRLKMFTESKLMGIESDAKLQQVDNGRKLQVARIEMYQQEGDYNQATAALDEGVGVYWSKEHAEAGKMKLKSAAKTAELNLMINETPNEAIETLSAKDKDGNYTYGGISPDRRRISLNKARTAKAQYRRAEIDDWEEKIANGLENPEMIEKVESEYLTKKDKSSLIKSMSRNSLPGTEDIESGMALIEEYIDYSKTSASDAEKAEAFMTLDLHLKSMYPTGTINPMRDRLVLHSPTQQASKTRARINDKAQSRVSWALKNGQFGDEDSLEAKERARKTREAIYDLARENPDFTEEDAEKVLRQRIGARNAVNTLNAGVNNNLTPTSSAQSSINNSAEEMGKSWSDSYKEASKYR